MFLDFESKITSSVCVCMFGCPRKHSVYIVVCFWTLKIKLRGGGLLVSVWLAAGGE